MPPLPAFVCSYCFDDFVPSRKEFERLKAAILAGNDPIAFCSPDCKRWYQETRIKTGLQGTDKPARP